MHLVIRADGGPDIGYGHLVRTSALAELALEHGHDVTCATTTPEVARSVYPDRVAILPLPVERERQVLIDWIENERPDAALTDSYEIDSGHQRSLRETVPCLCVVLDDTRHTVCADILVNGNVYAPNLEYEYEGDEPEWCIGLDYLLLREEIRTFAQQSPPWRDPPERALVTMGGSDIRGTTPEVLPTFGGTDLTVDVIIGPGFDQENERDIERVAQETEADFRLLRDPSDLVDRMFQADLAVSATGTTSYELLALGTPTVGIPQVDNQIPVAKGLSERGVIIHQPLEQIDELHSTINQLCIGSESRRSLQNRSRSLIDGHGTRRVYEVLNRNLCELNG
jgi:spore coat polysaccharide biosynthesis predicted glycosyltransferase SpsG